MNTTNIPDPPQLALQQPAPLSYYLDRLMKAQGLHSDSDIARHLGMNRMNVSNWRRGRPADVMQCWALAEALGIDHRLTILSSQWAAITDPDRPAQPEWKKVYIALQWQKLRALLPPPPG